MIIPSIRRDLLNRFQDICICMGQLDTLHVEYSRSHGVASLSSFWLVGNVGDPTALGSLISVITIPGTNTEEIQTLKIFIIN